MTIDELAKSLGADAADVLLLARLTATQVANGLRAEDAIKAADKTMKHLCNAAMRSIADFDASNPYGPAESFAHTIYPMLRA